MRDWGSSGALSSNQFWEESGALLYCMQVRNSESEAQSDGNRLMSSTSWTTLITRVIA